MEKRKTGMSKRKNNLSKQQNVYQNGNKSDNCTIFRGIRTGKFVHYPL